MAVKYRKGEAFPQKTVNCGNIKKPKWIDMKNAMQKTKYGRGAWMHGLREDIISECDDNLMVLFYT